MPSPSSRAAAVQLPIIPQVADWIREHPGTLSLGQGVAGYAPPPEAAAEIDRLRTDPFLHRYQAVGGMPELVEALWTKLGRRNGIPREPDRDLMVTAGANAGFLQVVLALCDPGDEVLLPVPWYFNQEMALTLANVRPVPVPTDPENLPDVEALARAVGPRTRAIVTVSPNNPTGAVYPREVLREINGLCARRGLVHICDETYEAFTFDGTGHFSPGSDPGAGAHTVSLFSFSKAYGLASWRVGYMVFPSALRESLRKIQDTNLICPPVVSQLAALGCLRAAPEWLAARLTVVGRARDAVLHGLSGMAPILSLHPASGAFYVWLRLHRPFEPLALVHRLIARHGVAVLPGSAFGDPHPGSLRVAYGALTPDGAAQAVTRLAAGLEALGRA